MPETILMGPWVDYGGMAGVSGQSYTAGGTIAGSALATYEANTGRQAAFVHLTAKWWTSGAYTPWSAYQTNVNTLLVAGRMVMMTWLPWDWANHAIDSSLNLDSIIAGTHDGYLTSFGTALGTWNKALLIRLMHEPNLQGQFPWQVGPTGTWLINGTGGHSYGGYVSGTWTNTSAKFVSAIQHIIDIMRPLAPKVSFVWCPNVVGSTDTVTLAQLYPGNDANGRPYADWMGLDGYGWNDFPDMTLGQRFRGTPNFPGGGSPGVDSYALITALHPSLPVIICETGWWGTAPGGPIAITAISVSGGVWTVTTASAPGTNSNAPNAGWAAGQGVQIAGAIPTGYNGQWTIASGIDATHFTITNAATPGTLTTPGTAYMIDRASRSVAVKQSLEIDIPTSMPRVKAVSPFWTLYSPSQWTMDYEGSQPNNSDMLTYKASLNSHYLVGNVMGADVSNRLWLPFQDQPMTTVGQERYSAVMKSSPGLFCYCPLNDASGPAVDLTGNGRNGTLNGTATLGAANVMPAEPTWTSASFPGTAGNNISFVNNAIWSPITNGTLSIELGFLLPSTPTAQGCLFGKASFTGGALFEYMIWVSATQMGVTLWNNVGSTMASWTRTLPSISVSHHLILVIDLSTANRFVTYLDSVLAQGVYAGGGLTMSPAGSAVPMLGQRADGSTPLPCLYRATTFAAANVAWSAETAANHFAAWRAAPVITVGPTAS